MPLARPGLAVVASLLLAGCPPASLATTDDVQTDTTASTSSETASSTADCPIGSQGCLCTGGAGCDLGLVCNLDTLMCEGSASTTGSEVTTEPSVQTSTGSSDEGNTSSDISDTVGPECISTGDGAQNKACMGFDPGRPFCVDDVCVPCGALADTACDLGTDGQQPLCLDSGACGQCNAGDLSHCTADLPHCDLDSNTCEGCMEHSECPQSACKVAERECFPGNIMYVRQGSMKLPCVDVPGSGGGIDNPYCDFELATVAAQLQGFNLDYVFIALANDAALGKGFNSVNIAGGDGKVSYAFLHEIGIMFQKHTQFIGIGPLINVPANVSLYINSFGVGVENGQSDTSVGVSCNGGSVWLDDSRVTGARGPNIRANDCDIHLRRSSVAFGSTEGVDLMGGSLRAVNSFITSNMSKPNLGGGGVHLHDGATVDLLYTTVADNANEPGKQLGDSIHCDGPATVKIRNSILARRPTGANATIACPGGSKSITYTTLDYTVPREEGNNTNKQAAEDMLKALDLENSTGVMRVNAMGLAMFKTARWVTGDPRFDYEWGSRTIDGSPDFAGADVY